MGKQTARDIAQDAKDGLTNLEAALIYHFRANHYPPLPLSLIPIAIQIVTGKVSEDDEIELPEGIIFRGRKTAPVRACIKSWHLSEFLLNPDDYENL